MKKMSVPEDWVIADRLEAELTINEFFDKYSAIITSIIYKILADLETGEITPVQAYERMHLELAATFGSTYDQIDDIIDRYVIDIYQIGLRALDESYTMSPYDLLLAYALFKVFRRYVSKTETEAMRKGFASIYTRKKPFKETYLASSFKRIIVSEGTRVIGHAQITRAQAENLLLLYVTAGDERVCPICAPLDNRIYKWDTALSIMPPQHPYCRCYFIIFKGEIFVG